jgi:hypothetical protein
MESGSWALICLRNRETCRSQIILKGWGGELSYLNGLHSKARSDWLDRLSKTVNWKDRTSQNKIKQFKIWNVQHLDQEEKSIEIINQILTKLYFTVLILTLCHTLIPWFFSWTTSVHAEAVGRSEICKLRF